MRHVMLAAASAVLLACLSACADDSDVASENEVVVQPAESTSPTPFDPFAWSDVPYADYVEAADQIGLRPDVLVPEAGFSSGLNTLCHTSAEDMAVMRSSHVEDVSDSGTYSTAKYLADEVGLRLGLACPQRMTDWTAAGVQQDDTDSDQTEEDSSVTGDDLDRATEEEVAESSEPSTAPDVAEQDDAGDTTVTTTVGTTGSSSAEDTGGTTTGNSDTRS